MPEHNAAVPAAGPGVRRRRSLALWTLSTLALVASLWVIAALVDAASLWQAVAVVTTSPWYALLPLAAFGTAFALRAWLWCRVLPGLPFGHSLGAIHIGLAANHLLPLRLGEGARALSLTWSTQVPLRAAAASTLVLRTADVLALVGLGWLLAPAILHRHLGWFAWGLPLALGLGLAGALGWLRSLRDSVAVRLRMPDPAVVVGTVAAWLLEAVLVWSSARWVGIPLTPSDAVVVTAASVVSQVAGVAPGGIGTYEAAAVGAYAALGHPAAQGLAAAVVAHALTTTYSLVAGAVGLCLLHPALRGRRLPSRAEAPTEPSVEATAAPLPPLSPQSPERPAVEGGRV